MAPFSIGMDGKVSAQGSLSLGGFGTFDNFNIVVSGVKGTIAAGINEIYDTLMVPASDEVSTEYGLLAEAVSLEGFDVRSAADGRDALAVLAHWSPDLILTDLSMPRMDGWAFQEELRLATEVYASADAVEGPAAFAEKREPRFRGR